MSSPPESDWLRDIADELRVVSEMTDELALEGDIELDFVGDTVCIVGVGIGVVACIVAGLFEVVAIVELGLGTGGVSLIGTNLACLACLIWVVRRARSRTRARGIKNSLADGWSHTGLTRLLGIAVRLFLPADVRWIKWEEWCAELACIDSRWERPCTSSTSWARCAGWPGRLVKDVTRAGSKQGISVRPHPDHTDCK